MPVIGQPKENFYPIACLVRIKTSAHLPAILRMERLAGFGTEVGLRTKLTLFCCLQTVNCSQKHTNPLDILNGVCTIM